MKSSLLIAWNIVLTIILVALLFIQLGKKSGNGSKESNEPIISNNKEEGGLRVAVINIDSMQNNYSLFVDKKKELENKQQQMEATLDKKMKDLQAEYTAAQQASTTMTQQQLQETEQRLQKKQADIQKLQTQLTTDLQTQLTQFNQQLKDSLDSFLEDYNASNKYTMILSIVEGGQVLYSEPQYDITADAIKWMNERIRP